MNMDYHSFNKERPKKEKLEISSGTLRRILYIGELPPNTDQYFLYNLITQKGKFTIDSITTKNTKDYKSYAYVKFGNETEALLAKELLHLMNINGYVIRTNIFNKHLEKTDNSKGNLFIKCLPEDLNSKELCDIFKTYGNIRSIKLKQGQNGECLGSGYIQFSNEKESELAMEKLNNTIIKGKHILIEKFHEKKERKIKEEERTTIIFIQQMPISIQTETELEKIVSEYGKILFVSLFKNNYTNLNNSLVIFEQESEAQSCLLKLNNLQFIEGEVPFKLTFSPSKEEIENFSKSKNDNFKQKYLNCNLIVKNLPKELNDRELFEIFREYGEITKAIIASDGKFVTKRDENGDIVDKEFIYESKGFGFVCFKKTESAENAIANLNYKNLNGKYKDAKITVEYYNYDRDNKEKSINYNKKPKPIKKKILKNNFNNNKHEEQYKNYYSNPNYNNQVRNYNQSIQQYPNHQYFSNIPNLPDKRQQYPRPENPFVYELIKNLNSTDDNNRREIIGEQIFYYLKNFLAVTKLNNTGIEDEKLCARFTGIFINSNHIDLIEIFRFEDTLIKTLKDIIYELQKDQSFEAN